MSERVPEKPFIGAPFFGHFLRRVRKWQRILDDQEKENPAWVSKKGTIESISQEENYTFPLSAVVENAPIEQVR